MTPLVAVRGLSFRYPGGPLVLDHVDFDLHASETVALLGPNGSGKTTFALHLNGLLQGEGHIEVCGLPVIARHYPEIRRKVGILFQDPDDQLFMPTVLEDVSFGPLNSGLPPAEALRRAREAIKRTGVETSAGRAPYHLSMGEKRRVALAGLLAMEPEVLVLDEPTTYLDPPGQRNLLEILASLPQAKVVVTHDTAFAAAIASRAVFFDAGRIAGSGTVAELLKRFDWRV